MTKRILLLASCLLMLMGAGEPEKRVLWDAKRLLDEKRCVEATEAYQTAIGEGLTGTARRGALFELAMCYQTSRAWGQAIGVYKSFLADLRPTKEDDPDLVRGQWMLAECYFHQGSYRLASEAMRTARGHSINSLCGTCAMGHAHRQAMREAVLHEYLGEYEAAVSGYLAIASSDRPADHLRLLTLYDTARQIPDLLRLIQEADERYAELIRKYRQGCQKDGYCPPEHSALYRTVHGILDLRGLEEASDWQALLSMLAPERPGGGWKHPDHELREAARLLARHPAATLPLLLPNAPQRGYYAVALGLTGTPEAVSALKEEARKESNFYQLLTLVDDLIAAGPEGAAALESLYPGAQTNLRLLIDRYRQGTLSEVRVDSRGGVDEFPFPPIPERVRLPSRCAYRGSPFNEYDCTSPAVGGGSGMTGEPGS